MSDTVRDYHERTKHRFERYAAGPEALDWEAQPDPFRHFAGCATVDLPLDAVEPSTPFAELDHPEQIAAIPMTLESLSDLLQLAFGLSAWKEYAGSRWALRCNPSSGNLHPTEAYAVPVNVSGIDTALYHYCSDRHMLERRCRFATAEETAASGILIGLSSVQWREAWKYGERAFRYCQLDSGHAMASLRYGAATLGWRVTLLHEWSDTDITTLLGLDQHDAFRDVEREEAEVLLWVSPTGVEPPARLPLLEQAASGAWSGHASLLDPKPMYAWPVIDQAAAASRSPGTQETCDSPAVTPPRLPNSCQERAAAIIQQRRSAQQFDPRRTLARESFLRLIDVLLPRPDTTPWDMWPYPPRLHPVLFVHRVEGIRPGLYALPRRPEAQEIMQSVMRPEFLWQQVEATLPLYLLVAADCQRAARTLACQQEIASHSAFSLAMLSEFDAALAEGAWHYRRLHQEAGMIGHTLYLEAEAAGVRGTGIGCFFDDAVHETLGITSTVLQDLYHFTVGFPLTDTRLQTLPAYAHLCR